MALKRLPAMAWAFSFGVFGLGLIFAVMASDISKNPDFVNALWIAEKNSVLKIATTDGNSLLEIQNIKRVKKLAVDNVNGVLWIARDRKLERYGFNGELLSSSAYQFNSSRSKKNFDKDDDDEDEKDESKHGNEDDDDDLEIKILSADPYDGSIWLGLENAVYHYSANMDLLAEIFLDDDLKALAPVSEKGHIWIATEHSLKRYASTLNEIQLAISLKSNEEDDNEIRDIAYDGALEQLWVAADNKLVRIDDEGKTVFSKIQKKVKTLATDGQGNVWLNLKKKLLFLDKNGNELISINPFKQRKDKHIRSMLSDPADGTVWVTGKYQILHIDRQGAVQHIINHDDKIQDIAIYSDIIPPVIKLLFPKEGDYINDNQPAFHVSYDDNGIGVDGTTLAFTVNGTEVPVACETMPEEANCTPATPLADGAIQLQATVEDFNGNQSEPAEVNFAVDTVPPEFIALSPEDNIYTNIPDLTLSGKSNESGSVSITHNGASILGKDLDNQFAFAAEYTLVEGANTFEIILADLASNTSQTTLIVYLDTIPPYSIQQSTLSPITISATGAVITGAAGSAEAGATVVVVNKRTGEEFYIQVADDGSFSITVPAEEGDELEVYVKDKAGNASEKITVIVEGALEIKITYPVNGAVFNQDTTHIIGTFKGPQNSGITVNGAIAAIDGKTFYLNNLSLNPGENEVFANLSTPAGITKTAVISVASNAESPFVVSPSPASGITPLTTQFILLNGPEFVPATVSFDFDSDGTVDLVSTGYDIPVEFTYSNPGTYLATIIITDDIGNSYTLTNYIVVEDLSVLDAKLRHIYQSMLDHLMVGDVQSAMHSVNGAMRDKFEQAFIDAGPKLAEIIPNLGTIEGGGVSGNIAEYIISREENGQKVYFTMYFLKDRDGIWRIGEM